MSTPGGALSLMVPSAVQLNGTAAEAAKSDSVDLATPLVGFIVNTATTIKYDDAEGNTHTFEFPIGDHAVQVRRIWSTGTDDLTSVFLGMLKP